jgi:hypothetical protein
MVGELMHLKLIKQMHLGQTEAIISVSTGTHAVKVGSTFVVKDDNEADSLMKLWPGHFEKAAIVEMKKSILSEEKYDTKVMTAKDK